MKKSAVFACLILVLFAAGSFAAEKINYSLGDHDMLYGGNPEFNKSEVDTFYLIGPWGSGAQVNGQFEDENGNPAWNGWTHYDVTQPTTTHWQISDYHADNLGANPTAGNLAAWCGDINIEACTEEDPVGGYGNAWNDLIEWRGAVDDPTIGVGVHFTAYANIDSEPGYDYTHIRYLTQDEDLEAAVFDGNQPNLLIDAMFSLEPADYQGEEANEVVIQVQFQSDGAWSDTDCLWPSAGAVQIDDITVSLDQGSGAFESYTDFQEGWGDWAITYPVGVGDFTQIWSNLSDIDPCKQNFSHQVAWIDDGLVVPGVGPSYCINWCYGPNGYIVNTTGGAAGPDAFIFNQLESPVFSWPDGNNDGAYWVADLYRHEDLSADAPGVFHTWGVRSTDSLDPADIEHEGWNDRAFVYYGGPDYISTVWGISDLLGQEKRFAQLSVSVYELGFAWDWEGNDGYPAPYWDNFRFVCYPFHGPGMSTREIDIANDNFPAIGEVDLTDLGNNSVRFDMANTSSLNNHLVNIPGDSIVFNIVPIREGADFVNDPELHWKLKKNPLFEVHRTSEYGQAEHGISMGFPAANAAGPVFGKWAFDLPDSNFLFPGDVLHYFILATDTDGVEVQSAYLPADTTGFSDFNGPLSYNSSFTVRALPSVYEDPLNPGNLITPKVLFWNDFANRGGQNEWHGALANLGFVPGQDYDTYYTNGPTSGVGNGLGGRATAYSLIGYQDILYTAGDLSTFTISNGDYNNDPGNDIEVLDSWLRQGTKDLFMTGDELAYDLVVNAGAVSSQFVTDWMKVSFVDNDLRPLIGNQATPLVKVIPGNGVLSDSMEWIAYGGCYGINRFDVLETNTEEGAIRLAEFTDPGGATGQYSFSAATYYHDTTYNDRIISLPYDLMYIYNDQSGGKANASLPARALLLGDVLAWFGIEGDPLDVTPVPGAEKFAVRSYPNPFNPAVKIEYTMPKAGHLRLKVYNVRGQLVRTLLDERIESSGHIMWDGTDGQGSGVASGVYFYEARTGGQIMVEKLTLIR